MSIPPVVALEIGTSKVVVLVGEMREDGSIVITGIGERESTGVRKGDIVDLQNAAHGVRAALAAAEESGKVTIHQVHLAVSGGHIQSTINRGAVPVLDPEGVIGEEDVDQVMEVARAISLSPDREILHTICQHYSIDNQGGVIRPEEMVGASLALTMLILHGIRSRIQNVAKVVQSVPMSVTDTVFSGICSALSVLTPEQKHAGVIVIDLGGGTTDYVAYADDVLAAAGSIGVGGDHVTNDIALAFRIPTAQAERLKRESGSAMPASGAGVQQISLPAEGGFPGRTLKQKALNAVIHARMDEVLVTIRKRLEKDSLLHHMGAGVILTGGGARLAGVKPLAERVFDLPCAIGTPRNVTGLAGVTEGPEYATATGLVQYAFRDYARQSSRRGFMGMLRQLFGEA